MKEKTIKKSICYISIIVILINMSLITKSKAAFEPPEKITIASSSDYKPFSYVNGQGNPEGAIIDFWKSWGRINGVKVEFKMVPWLETLELVKNGEADIHAGLFYNKERASYLDFGSSYMDIMTGIYVHKDVEAWDISDIKEVGIGVTEKNNTRTYLEEYYPDTKLLIYSNLDEVIRAVEHGEVKAISVDYHGTLSKVTQVYSELKDFTLLQTLYTQPLRIGVKKGNGDLLAFVNQGISKMSYNEFRRTQSSWEYITIYLTRGKITMYGFIGSIIIITLLFINIFLLRRRIRIGVKSLAESEENYKKLVELCPDGIFVQCKEKIVFTNKSAAKVLGTENIESILNKNFLNFVHENRKKIVEDRMYMIEKNRGTTLPLEEQIISVDGQTVDVEIISNAITYNGSPATLSIIRDISSRKEKEKEQQRVFDEKLKYERLKTEFFANISHELRTPLNIILGTIQLLNKKTRENGNLDNEFYKKYSRMMMQNCYRLLRLINNLIDITKLDVGYLKMDFRNYNIVEIIEDITISVAGYIGINDIDMIFDTNTEEKIISFDADKIERVLLNLLSNAVKFTKPGGSIFVNVYDEGEKIRVSVEDTGIGIPKEEQKSIFERFRQVQPLFNREREGSGIGLSLVKSIIESHGGHIHVESEYGKGSKFIIELPVKVVEEEEIVNKDAYTTDKVETINIEFSDIYSI